MQMKPTILPCLLFGLSAFGFSPYENYLHSGQQTHVAIFASADDGKTNELATALKTLNGAKTAKAFKKVNISNVSTYAKELQGKKWYLIYFDYDGEDYLDARNAFESVDAAKALTPLVIPHPRAKANGTTWLQLEWINYIHGASPNRNTPNKFAMVTRLKPEKEAEYRWLHQSTWPGVADRMTHMGYHDFSIFLVELGDELYEFFYVESIGTDAAKDKMGCLADPTYERWIKHTEPCQNPLPGTNGTWAGMEKISE